MMDDATRKTANQGSRRCGTTHPRDLTYVHMHLSGYIQSLHSRVEEIYALISFVVVLKLPKKLPGVYIV